MNAPHRTDPSDQLVIKTRPSPITTNPARSSFGNRLGAAVLGGPLTRFGLLLQRHRAGVTVAGPRG